MKTSKLVRDNIPDIIRENEGEEPATYVADDAEYAEHLKEKLLEEVNEYLATEETEELADILEVIDAICAHHNLSLEEIMRIKEKKADERGSFQGRVMLDL